MGWHAGPASGHVPRPALVAALLTARIAVIEAAGGSGKSALLAELANVGERHTVVLACQPRDRAGDVFASSLVATVRASGLEIDATSDGADREGEDGNAALRDLGGRIVGALARVPSGAVLAIDDAHHLDGEGAALLTVIADTMPSTVALVVLARRLPVDVIPLAGRADVRIADADLAFGVEQTDELCAGLGVRLRPSESEALVRITGGWAAAIMLAGTRLSLSADPAIELRRLAAQPEAFRPLVDAALEALDSRAQPFAIQLAHLPYASREIVAALGRPDLLDELRSAGLPLGPVPGGWVALPGPVNEMLAELQPPDRDMLRLAASAFSRLGEPLTGAGALVRTADPDGAARLLAGLAFSALGPVEHAELDAIVSALPRHVLAAHPAVLLHLARTAHLAGQLHRRRRVLDQARALLADTHSPVLQRAVEAEIVRERVREGDYVDGRRDALAVLAQCDDTEPTTRSALLHAAGSASVRLGDTREAERYLSESIALYRTVGDEAGLADALIGLGYSVYCYAGEFDLAIAPLEEVLALETVPLRLRAAAFALLGETLEGAGKLDDAARMTREGGDLAARIGDRRLAAYSHWELARIAAAQGDAESFRGALRQVEANRADWFDQLVGAQFLADAAELAVRVGEVATARDYLVRARAHPLSVASLCSIAEASIEARHGEPTRVLTLLDEAEQDAEPAPRVRLLISFLRAHALLRGGDPSAGVMAADVFDRADRLGDAAIPFQLDATIAAGLVGLAMEHGSAAAARAWHVGHRIHVSVLGRCEITVGGRLAPLPAGLATQLLGCVAVHGGRCHVDVILEALWPNEDPTRSRTLLRKLLSKTNTVAGEVLVRDGDVLAFVAETTIDLVDFDEESRRAIALRSTARLDGVARARIALSKYRGDVLPDERYAEWAIVPRERFRQRRNALLEVLIADADRRNDLQTGLILVEDLIAADPDEEGHYVAAARMLVAAGQFGRARSYLSRADESLSRLDLPRSDQHDAVRGAMGMAGDVA